MKPNIVSAASSLLRSRVPFGWSGSRWFRVRAALFASVWIGGILSAVAAPIGVGNLVIYRVGDGVAPLGTAAAPVFLDEYGRDGAFVQTIALPTIGTDALSAVGTATTEGIISRSQDGGTLLFTGYRKDVGGTNPSADAPATTNRVIATVRLSGVVDTTSVSLTDPTGTIRSATSVDGSSFLYVGTSAGVRYVPTPAPTTTTTVIDTRNSRQVNLSNNVLFASNGSTTIGAKVQTYGTLPTIATAPTPVVTLATTDAVNGFALFDVNPGIAGDDTLYALSTVANLLLKYTFDGTTWMANGSLPASSAQNLAGEFSAGTVNLFLTSGTGLFSFSDSSGFGGNLSGSFVPLGTAATNTAFRGIGFIAVPEPSACTLALLALAGAGVFRLPRRHTPSS